MLVRTKKDYPDAEPAAFDSNKRRRPALSSQNVCGFPECCRLLAVMTTLGGC